MKKRIKYCIVAIMFLMLNSAAAQEGVLASPEQTIASLFKAMYEGDSTTARMVFHEDVTLHSVFKTKSGEQKINTGSVDNFINAIGSPHDEIWDERISNLVVKVDGDLAHAWMDYSFYLDNKFSHCGVNAIHLIRQNNYWKIFQIIDTRRKSDCN